jgi:hypothetical protein
LLLQKLPKNVHVHMTCTVANQLNMHARMCLAIVRIALRCTPMLMWQHVMVWLRSHYIGFFWWHWAAAQDNALSIHHSKACDGQGDEFLVFSFCLLHSLFSYLCVSNHTSYSFKFVFVHYNQQLCELSNFVVLFSTCISHSILVFCICTQHHLQLPFSDCSIPEPFCFLVLPSSFQPDSWFFYL